MTDQSGYDNIHARDQSNGKGEWFRIAGKRSADRKAITRERILKAALECFAEKGYKETTVDEIAEKANVSKGNIYWHFKSKPDIFRAVIKEEVKKIHNLIEEEDGASLPLVELWKRKAEKAFNLVRGFEKQLKVFYEVAFRAWKAEETRRFFLEIEKDNVEKHKRILEKELKARRLKLPEDEIENIAKLQTLFHQAITFRLLILQEDERSWKELKEIVSSFIDILAFYIEKRSDRLENQRN